MAKRPSALVIGGGFYGCALARHFESIGVHTVNSSAAVSQSRDKLYSLQLLLKRGIRIPTTGFANSPMDTSDLIDMVGGAPLIIKLLEGAQGRGVVLGQGRRPVISSKTSTLAEKTSVRGSRNSLSLCSGDM